MIKSNPNFNEYYGLFHQISHKSYKLKRTECSNEKLEYSKKSNSQESRSDKEANLYKRSKHLQDFMNRRKLDHHKKTNEKVDSPESPKQHHILDLFKRKDLSGERNLRKSVDLYPETRSKKYNGIIYKESSSKKIDQILPAPKYELGEYFGNSVDLKNIRSNRNSSKSSNLRNKRQIGPLKMLKSKSRQELYSPVEKMLNVIKQEQKVRQQTIQNQKTFKQINYFRSLKNLDDLNETRMNFPSLKHFQSEKNLYQMTQQDQKKKKNHKIFHHNETSNPKNVQHAKYEISQQKSLSKKLKTTESMIFFKGTNDRQQQKQPISSSKITKYFNRKQQIQKDKIKMRNLLETIGSNKELLHLRKFQSEPVLAYSNSELNGSQVSQSMISNFRDSSKNQMRSSNKISNQSGYEGSQNLNESICEYSDYGFNVQDQPVQQKLEMENKKFYKNSKQNSYKFILPEIPQSPAGLMIDQIKSFQSGQFEQFLNVPKINQKPANSMTSIEERLMNPSKQYNQDSQISSQKSDVSIKPIKYKVNIQGLSEMKFHSKLSVNTPAFRDGITNKKPKESIISKLKKDIKEDKKKSTNKLKPDKRFMKKQSEVSKKGKTPMSSSYLLGNEQERRQNASHSQSSHQIQSVNNIKIQSREKKSQQKQPSNLISSSEVRQLSDLPHPELKHKNTWNESTNHFKATNLKNQVKIKISNNIEAYGHDLSEFQSIGSQENSSKRTSQINSMINSNKIDQKMLQGTQSVPNQTKLISNKNSSIKSSKNLEKQGNQPLNFHEEKKAIKILKVIKKLDSNPVAIPHIEESNIASQIDSYQTESITSSQATPLISSSSQSLKFHNSTQKLKFSQLQQKIIKQEEASELQSSRSGSSIDMSSTSSVYTESQKSSKIPTKKISDSEYSESLQSRVPTSNKVLTSLMSQSLQNQNRQQSSEFTLSNSSASNNNSVSKSSSLSSASKKFANANKFNSLPKNKSHMFKKKKNFTEYTLNDVARYIEEHEFRIESYCFYIDNSKNAYEEDYELQKIQLLSFLMLKKNIFELSRAIAALQGTGENVFTLTDVEILDEVLHDYRDRQEITQQLNNIMKHQKQTIKELQETYKSLQKKYNGEKGFNLFLDKDDISTQIVKKLGQELNYLYEKWEKNKSLGDKITARKICQKLQKRMIEIIELIFLTSEIDGKKVKPFQILENEIEFLSYYEKWYQRIIQTIEYFDEKSKYSN